MIQLCALPKTLDYLHDAISDSDAITDAITDAKALLTCNEISQWNSSMNREKESDSGLVSDRGVVQLLIQIQIVVVLYE